MKKLKSLELTFRNFSDEDVTGIETVIRHTIAAYISKEVRDILDGGFVFHFYGWEKEKVEALVKRCLNHVLLLPKLRRHHPFVLYSHGENWIAVHINF